MCDKELSVKCEGVDVMVANEVPVDPDWLYWVEHGKTIV